MAAFTQHLVVSSGLGAGYATIATSVGVQLPQAVLAGALCSVSGILPNMDRASDKPVRGLFSLTAVAVSLLQLRRLQDAGLTTEGIIVLLALLYLAIRFGVAWLFEHLAVHRGMCHSVPAAVIAAEVVFLAYDCPQACGPWVLAGGVLVGFLSHLLLDDFSIVDVHRGAAIPPERGAGVALKLVSRSLVTTLLIWVLLGALTYLVAVKDGYCESVHLARVYETLGSWLAEVQQWFGQARAMF